MGDNGPSDNGAACIRIALGQLGALIDCGLAQLLREDPATQIVAADLDSTGLVLAVAQEVPHVAVLDESVVSDGDIIKHLRDAQPGIGIVVLAHSPTRAYGARLLAAGGTCLSKYALREDIVATIHFAAKGMHIFADLPDRPLASGTRPLTAREEEVLGRIRLGESNAQLAAALCISLETVRSHTAKIRRKLRVKSTAELVDLTTAVPIPIRPRRTDTRR